MSVSKTSRIVGEPLLFNDASTMDHIVVVAKRKKFEIACTYAAVLTVVHFQVISHIVTLLHFFGVK